MAKHVCADDCLGDGYDVESPLKGTAESEIDLQCASRVDRYLGTIGGVEVQDRRQVPMSSCGGKNTNIRASIDEEPYVGVAISNM